MNGTKRWKQAVNCPWFRESLRMTASGPECVKTPPQTLAMISEDFIAGIAHEALYPR
jgi:hypothetical protein